MVTSLFAAIILASLCITTSSVAAMSIISNTTTCEPADFNYNVIQKRRGYCSLECQLDSEDEAYQWYSAGFYYYTNDESDRVQILDYVDGTESGPTITLTLYDYNSGTYLCEIITRDVDKGTLSSPLKAKFKIGDLSMVELGDSCRAHQDCMALNAQCVDGECKCDGVNYIKYSKHHDTAACLAPVTSNCVIDEQCQNIDSTFTCQGSICLKTSHSRMSPTEIAGVTLGTLGVTLLCVIAGRLATKK